MIAFLRESSILRGNFFKKAILSKFAPRKGKHHRSIKKLSETDISQSDGSQGYFTIQSLDRGVFVVLCTGYMLTMGFAHDFVKAVFIIPSAENSQFFVYSEAITVTGRSVPDDDKVRCKKSSLRAMKFLKTLSTIETESELRKIMQKRHASEMNSSFSMDESFLIRKVNRSSAFKQRFIERYNDPTAFHYVDEPLATEKLLELRRKNVISPYLTNGEQGLRFTGNGYDVFAYSLFSGEYIWNTITAFLLDDKGKAIDSFSHNYDCIASGINNTKRAMRKLAKAASRKEFLDYFKSL